MRSCTCADVSDFKYRDIKLFLLKREWELKYLVKKFQSTIKIQTKHRPNFHEVESTTPILKHLGSKTTLTPVMSPSFLTSPGKKTPARALTRTRTHAHAHTRTHTNTGYPNTDHQRGHYQSLLMVNTGSIVVFWRLDKKKTVMEIEKTAVR